MRWRIPLLASLALHAAAFAAGMKIVGTRANDRGGESGEDVVVLVAPPTEPDPDEVELDVPSDPPPEPVEPPEVDSPPLPPPEPAPPEDLTPPEELRDVDEPPPTSVPEPVRAPPPDAVVRPRPHVPPPPATPPSISVPVRPGGPPPTARAALRAIESPDPPLVADVPVGATAVLFLEYTITSDGRVTDARVTTSSGYPGLDASTRDFVTSRWLYAPPGTDRRVVRRFVFTRRA